MAIQPNPSRFSKPHPEGWRLRSSRAAVELDGLLHDDIESSYKRKSGGEKVYGQGDQISARRVGRPTEDVDQHREHRSTPQNDKGDEDERWRSFSNRFPAPVRVGQQQRQHRKRKAHRCNSPKPGLRNVEQRQKRGQQRSTTQREK